jgi:hypothetical protein
MYRRLDIIRIYGESIMKKSYLLGATLFLTFGSLNQLLWAVEPAELI